MSSYRVFIADDHPVFRRGLARAFEDAGFEVCGVAPDGELAEQGIRDVQPDAAILDISMPKKTGIEVIRSLNGSLPTKFLLLTGSESQDTIYNAMAVGAAGYLLKTSDWNDLIDATRRVIDGDTVIATEVMGMLQAQIQGGARKRVELSDREAEILTLVAKGIGTAQIAKQLHIEQTTVKTHQRRAYDKLKVNNAPAAIAEAMRQGLIR